METLKLHPTTLDLFYSLYLLSRWSNYIYVVIVVLCIWPLSWIDLLLYLSYRVFKYVWCLILVLDSLCFNYTWILDKVVFTHVDWWNCKHDFDWIYYILILLIDDEQKCHKHCLILWRIYMSQIICHATQHVSCHVFKFYYEAIRHNFFDTLAAMSPATSSHLWLNWSSWHIRHKDCHVAMI
jgi:hypothetical protein